MPPSYSLYDVYADAILNRDALLLGIAAAVFIVFALITAYSYLMPRIAYVARLIGVGGFYASAILAYLAFH